MEQTTFPPEILLQCMDWAGIEKAVLLQGPFYGEQNAEVAEAVKNWPDRFVGAAFVDPWARDAQKLFFRAVEEEGFRVVKLELTVNTGLAGLHAGGLDLDDPRLAWFWKELDARRMVLTLDLGPVDGPCYQTCVLARLIQEFPNIKVVIAHLAQPASHVEQDPELWSLWEEQIQLGREPTVWFDLSALPDRVENEEYPFPTVGRWIRRAVELIGAKKLMWGSDAPGLLAVGNYRQLLALMIEHLKFLSPTEQELILGKTAQHVYPFPPVGGSSL
jgi:predicted TIM-barrel fold metal-dependent hydrolase